MSEQDCVPYALVLGENHLVLGEPAIVGVLVTRRQRLRPSGLVWSGDDIFVWGRGDPHPLWRSSLVEPGTKVTVIVFTEETWWPSCILLVSATTTWM